MAAPTYHGSASDPADNGSGAEPRTSTITPPASMVTGDLVVVVIVDGLSTAPDSSVLTTGGQTWSARVDMTGANNIDYQMFWCQYNGTWSVNPAFTIAAHSGTIPVTVVMHVFRPDAAGTWSVDQALTGGAEVSASPVVITGVTNTKKDTVTLAGTGIRASVATWGSVSGSGWVATGTAQYRNTNGTDSTCTFAHRLSAASGASGDVSITPSAAAAGASFIASWSNERTPPTITPNTADATDFGADTTPTLEATATDGNGDDVRYNFQIDSVNTFDSQVIANQVVDTYNESNQSDVQDIDGSTPTATAQSFTNNNAAILKSAKFYLQKLGSPTGNAVAKLYAHSGTFGSTSIPTGAALATSDNFDVSTLTTSLALVSFTFTGAQQYSMVAETKYVIALEYSGGDATNTVRVGYDGTSPTHAGNNSFFTSPTWTEFASRDLPFYVYADISTPLLNKISGTDAGFLNTVSGGASVDDSYSESNQDSSIDLDGTNTAGGQSFKSRGGVLKSAKFYLKKFGTPTGNATAKVYAHSGTFGTSSVPTGAALATSDTFDVSSLTTSFQLISLSFSGGNQISLTNQTSYVIVFDYSSGTGSNFPMVGSDVSGPSHVGNGSRFTSGAWVALAGTDSVFYVYVEDTDPFNSGEKVSFTVQGGDALTTGTYYWHARANDVNAGNTWSAWTTTRSFTITTAAFMPDFNRPILQAVKRSNYY